MKKQILVFGAGAIGRGYLPWIFDLGKYQFTFIDTNQQIIERMRTQRLFASHRVDHGKILIKKVECEDAWTTDEFAGQSGRYSPDLIFISVGPRNCLALGDLLKKFDAPIILCENDPKTVDLLKYKTGRNNYYFAVPDVITSNTAPKEILSLDPLAVMTESGTLFIDKAAGPVDGDCVLADQNEIDQQWLAKLYLHNTPHCIAAYLGALSGKTYLHESMAMPALETVIKGAMEEMLVALKRRWEIPHAFLDWYAAKELDRFRDHLLHDPISRVAREPLRKLDLDGRLIGAAQICLEVGVTPINLMTGIAAAILYEDDSDADSHIKMMRDNIPSSVFFSTILGLRKGEALESLMIKSFDRLAKELTEIRAKDRFHDL